jgi:hypothetical protein
MTNRKKERTWSERRWNPRPEEEEEIARRLYVMRGNFAIWTLQGMLNALDGILYHVLSKGDQIWFRDCIEYLIRRIKEDRRRVKSIVGKR